jgi:hypothetical protein
VLPGTHKVLFESVESPITSEDETRGSEYGRLPKRKQPIHDLVRVGFRIRHEHVVGAHLRQQLCVVTRVVLNDDIGAWGGLDHSISAI